jgi:hypothetical protein
MLAGWVRNRCNVFGGECFAAGGAENFDGIVAGESVEGDDRGVGARCGLPDSESGRESDEHEFEMRDGLLEGRIADCDFDEGWRFVFADFGQDA